MNRSRHVMIVAAFLMAAAGPVSAETLFTNTLTRVAFGSCLHQDDPQPVWDAITEAQPDLFLLIGDSIYLDTTNATDKAEAYEKQRSNPGFREFVKTCPWWGIWDDHDYGYNDAGGEYPQREISQNLFLDFVGEPEDSPRWTREGLYGARVYGPPGRQVQIILLDTRSFRSPLHPMNPRLPGEGPYDATTDRDATLLGPAQWTWFREQLRKPAQLRLVVSGIQVVAQDHHWEKWMNFPHERQLLLDMISDTEADGVIFLSGDRHRAELSLLPDGAPYPLYDLTSSSLNMKPDIPLAEINPRRVSQVYTGDNFGLVTIDWEKPDPLITLEIRSDRGETVIQHSFSLRAIQAAGRELPY
ncbi:MAG TPA: alkaline phosphatase D family protein [Kiritimatiellia bacterium]|nr:alkaline phosphatase D family protein [Kiritimatiellia bacterium]